MFSGTPPSPALINIENGFATPFASNHADRTFSGSIYDGNGNICPYALRTSLGQNEWNPNDPSTITPPIRPLIIKGSSLYLGHYTGHYGHFLIESLSRFWAIKHPDYFSPYDNFIFHPFLHKCPPFKKFPPAALAFDAFKINPKNVILIDQLLGFEKITVPSALFNINHGVHHDMSTIYQALINNAKIFNLSPNIISDFLKFFSQTPASNKIYVSRRRTSGYHPMQNEREIESLFMNLGFFILHPEHYPYHKQLSMLNNASVLAGVEGSGLHNSVFMPKGSKVIQIGTPREPTGEIFNQKLCDSLSSVISYAVPFKGKITRGNKAIYDLNFIHQSLRKIL